MFENMRVRNSVVIVKRDENPTLFPGTSIILPENLYTDSPVCTVVAVGPGRQKRSDLREYVDAQPGDLVVLDNIFTDERNKIADNLYYVDCKAIECIVKYTEETE